MLVLTDFVFMEAVLQVVNIYGIMVGACLLVPSWTMYKEFCSETFETGGSLAFGGDEAR